MASRPRLLLLSYCFPPAALPEALLSAKRLGNLAEYDVDVVAMDPTGTAIRADHSLDAYVAKRFAHVERVAIPGVLSRLLGRKISAVFQVPCVIAIMNRRALAASLALDPERYAAMISWSQWHSIHLVALELKRRYPRLPWVAHLSDPWADNPFAPLRGLLQGHERRHEAAVFAAADRLSLTSQETIDLIFSGVHARHRGKAVCLPHGFDASLYPPVTVPRAGPMMMRSLGNFYGARSPEPLFRALAIIAERSPDLLERIRVELIGAIPAEFQASTALRALPQGVVSILKPVDYTTSLALMGSADLLLNIDAPFATSVFLPSKLVDYIGAGRPILGLTPLGTASRVIREIGGWVAPPDDPAIIAATLEAALAAVACARDAPWGDQAVRRSFAAFSVAEAFSRVLDEARMAARA